MLSCSIWFSAPILWMGGGHESRCVGRVYGADSAVRRTAPFFSDSFCTTFLSVGIATSNSVHVFSFLFLIF